MEQAKIAEAAGAVAVMALERIPADIRFAEVFLFDRLLFTVFWNLIVKLRWWRRSDERPRYDS